MKEKQQLCFNFMFFILKKFYIKIKCFCCLYTSMHEVSTLAWNFTHENMRSPHSYGTSRMRTTRMERRPSGRGKACPKLLNLIADQEMAQKCRIFSFMTYLKNSEIYCHYSDNMQYSDMMDT